MLIRLLSAAAIGCVWGWLLGSCAFAKLRHPIWTGIMSVGSTCLISIFVGVLASRSALFAFLIANMAVLPIRVSYGK